jgi:nucleoside-diphosphate-sugar epimerase
MANSLAEGLNPSIVVDAKMSFPDDAKSSGGLKYHASKILAHRATLEWASTNSPHFNIITLHPSFVFGRNLTQTSPEALDGTNAMLWGSLHSPRPFIPMSAVDVADVASAHLKSLDVKVGQSNQVDEFILSASEKDGWTWGNVAEFVKAKYPQVKVGLEGPFDEPPKVDTQRAEQVLDIKWRKMEDTISSFLDHQIELKAQHRERR